MLNMLFFLSDAHLKVLSESRASSPDMFINMYLITDGCFLSLSARSQPKVSLYVKYMKVKVAPYLHFVF